MEISHSIGELLIVALAVYRVSYLLAIDEGPFGSFDWARNLIDPNQKTWIGRGLHCIGCWSFWVAFGATLLLHGSVAEWLALAGAVLIIHKAVNHG